MASTQSTFLRLTAAAVVAAFLPVSLSAVTIIRCDSHGPRRVCAADTRGGVSLRYQYSDEGCWQGNTWGFDSTGIWVSGGCKADFTLGIVPPKSDDQASKDNSNAVLTGILIGALAGAAITAAVSNNNNPPPPEPGYPVYPGDGFDNYPRQIRCESNHMDYVECGTGRIHNAELARQYSGSPCIYGQTWGYRRNTLWVSNGCRADFWVR